MELAAAAGRDVRASEFTNALFCFGLQVRTRRIKSVDKILHDIGTGARGLGIGSLGQQMIDPQRGREER